MLRSSSDNAPRQESLRRANKTDLLNFFPLGEPTAAKERERFIKLTRSACNEEDETEEQKRFLNTTQKRMQKMQTTQSTAMPKVCQGMPYTGPVIITHKVEKSGNNCVITNDTHSKSTNNGFSRGAEGRFFCH